MLGTTFQKPLTDYDAYEQAADWCTENNDARIEDKGDYYEVVAIPALTTEQQAASVRAERDARLKKTDLIIIRCAETGEPVPAEWKTYRQALRDIPQQAGFPDAVVWPQQPEGGVQAAAEKEDITETEEDTAGQAA